MRRILIVEDEKDMQDIYMDMFSDRSDYKIHIEGGTMPALRRLTSENYDLIILDIIMEPIAGDSFFVYLKSDARTESIPVLVVSVLGPEIMDKLKRVDHAHFLQKPITKEKLFETIESIMKERGL
jgi:CheY-like chemotaxis protein